MLLAYYYYLLEPIKFVCVCMCFNHLQLKSPTQYRDHDKTIFINKGQCDGKVLQEIVRIQPHVT